MKNYLNRIIPFVVCLIVSYSCETDQIQPETIEIEENRLSSKSPCGFVDGPECASPGQTITYVLDPKSFSGSFSWSVVQGNMKLVSGDGTTSATYQLLSNFDGGEIQVEYGGGSCTNRKTIAKCSGNCGYSVSIPSGYIDGTHSGSNAVYLSANTSFPNGAVYAWEIERQYGSINYYPANSDNPRLFAASYNNPIVKSKVIATYLNCTDTYTKTYVVPIPENQGDGGGFN